MSNSTKLMENQMKTQYESKNYWAEKCLVFWLFCGVLGLFFWWKSGAAYFAVCLLIQDFTTLGVRYVKCHVMQLLEFSQLVRLDFPGRIFSTKDPVNDPSEQKKKSEIYTGNVCLIFITLIQNDHCLFLREQPRTWPHIYIYSFNTNNSEELFMRPNGPKIQHLHSLLCCHCFQLNFLYFAVMQIFR